MNTWASGPAAVSLTVTRYAHRAWSHGKMSSRCKSGLALAPVPVMPVSCERALGAMHKTTRASAGSSHAGAPVRPPVYACMYVCVCVCMMYLCMYVCAQKMCLMRDLDEN